MAGYVAEGAVINLRSTAGTYDVLPASAQAILGQYAEEGHNHGRRTYRRRATGAKKGATEMVLFYWDMRDGRNVSGWWIGDKVGGGQVWAHNQSASATPPQRGWRCPTDGPEQKHILCELRGGHQLLRPKQEDGFASPAALPPGKRGAATLGQAGDEPPWKRHGGAEPPAALVLQSSLGEDGTTEKVRPLLGEYVPQPDQNHGRPTYRKQDKNGEIVWLYYWDQRDGRDASGWWLGQSVGGDQVFGRSSQLGALPAARGWRIPHDGPPRNDVSVTTGGQDEEAELPEQERLRRAHALATEVPAKAEKALVTASALLDREGDSLEDAVRAVTDLLKVRVRELEAAVDSLARHGTSARKQGASEKACEELGGLEERLRDLLQRAASELDRAQARLAALEREAAAEHDSKAVEVALATSMEAVAQAESSAELAASDDTAAQARQMISVALTQVNEVLEAAQGYGPEAKSVALREFGSLRARCEEAELRLASWSGGAAVLGGKAAADSAAAASAAEGDGEAAEDDAPLMAMAVEPAADDDAELGEVTEMAVVDSDAEDATSMEEWVSKVTAQVLAVETKARRAIETAQVVLLHNESEDHESSVRLCCELLEETLAVVAKAEKACARRAASARAKEAAAGIVQALDSLAQRVLVERSRLSQELDAAHTRVEKLRRQSRDEREAKAAEFALPAVREAVDAAEDAVEAIIFQAGDMDWRRTQLETGVEFASEYGEEIKKALDGTQQAAEAALTSIGAAKARLQAQVNAARQLPAEAQKAALEELAPLRQRLAEAQEKLAPFKLARKEYDEQLSAKEELESLARRMAAVEAEIEGVATLLAAPISTSGADDTGASARAALAPVQAALNKAFTAVEDKATIGLSDLLRERLTSLRDRGMAAQAKLVELKDAAERRQHRASGGALLQRGRREAEKAAEWLKQIMEVQEPFAGREVLPEAQAAPALVAADKLAVEAEPALQACKTALLELLVEAKQTLEGLSSVEVSRELAALQARVDEVALAATQLKVDTFARRTKSQMAEAVEAVVAAESAAARSLEVAAPLGEDNLEATPFPVKKVQEACAKVAESLKAASAASAAAQRAVDEKRRDPKDQVSPSFHTQLTKLAERLGAAEATVNGLKRCTQEAEGNCKLLQAQKAELAALAAKVDEVELLTLPLGDERPSDEVSEAQESKAASVLLVQDTVEGFQQRAEALADNPHGAMKLAMGRLLPGVAKLRERLRAARAGNRAVERALCRVLMRQGKPKLEPAQAAMAKAEQAEGPFLKGIEILEPALHQATVAACEAAATEARKVMAKARTTLEGQLREVATFGCADEPLSGRACVEALRGLLQHLKGLEAKLASYEGETKDRKRSAAGFAK